MTGKNNFACIIDLHLHRMIIWSNISENYPYYYSLVLSTCVDLNLCGSKCDSISMTTDDHNTVLLSWYLE